MFLLAPPPPPLMLCGASLWVDDGQKAQAVAGQALLVKGGRITAMAPAAQLAKRYPKAHRIELPGGTLLPGFIEGHAHVESLGRLQAKVDLREQPSLEAALDRVRAWAGHQSQGWITGRGWDQNLWPGKSFPDAKALDAITGDRPAALRRVDGHALWVNTAVLRLAGIGATTPDPAGGKILRDAQGQATGVLLDNAMELVERHQPAPSFDQREAWTQTGLRALQALGFTSVCDMGGDAVSLKIYRKLAQAKALPIRVFSYFDFDPKLALTELKLPRARQLSFFQVQGTKHYFDGALGSRGARMTAPYADAPETQGLWVTTPDQLARDASLVRRAGYQPAAHAIGDAANHAALTALGGVLRGTRSTLAPRLEHAQIVTREDALALGKAGLVASVQPMHLADDHAWTPARLGTDRVDDAFPWRHFLAGGARVVFGSDAPIADANPFQALATAETRQDSKGQPPGGFILEQRLSRVEALRAYTLDSARVLARPELGRLKVGAVADLLWVEAPVAELSPAALRTLKPGRLWVNGLEVKRP